MRDSTIMGFNNNVSIPHYDIMIIIYIPLVNNTRAFFIQFYSIIVLTIKFGVNYLQQV